MNDLLMRSCLVAWCGWWIDISCGVLAGASLVKPSYRFTHKVSALATNYCVWFLAGVAFVILERLTSVLPWTWLRLLLRFSAVWFAGTFLAVSWIVYKRAQIFLGGEGPRFLQYNWRAVLQHVLPVEGRQMRRLACGTATLAILWLMALDGAHQWVVSRGSSPLIALSSGLFALGMGMCVTERRFLLHADRWRLNPTARFQLTRLQRYHTSPLMRLVFAGMATVTASRFFPRALHPEIVTGLTRDTKRIVSLSSYLAGVPPARRSRPHVIVILIESLRADRLRHFGATREVMPCLDELAQRAWVFSRSFSQSTHSNYADPCVLSSHYPLRSLMSHHYRSMTYPRVLLPDILKGLGYRTAIFSSQNEHWGGMLRYLDTGCWDTIFHAATAGLPTYLDPLNRGTVKAVQLGLLTHGKLEDETTVREALAWMRHHHEQPCFLYMNLQNSHFPYRFPQSMQPRYVPTELEHSISFVGYPRAATPIMVNRYDNSLRWVDTCLERFVRGSASFDLLDQAVVVISGDTGQAFHEHGLVTHASQPWNEVVRVPLIIRAPTLAPAVLHRNVQHIDIPPSILDLLDLPPHPSFQGRSVLQNEDPARALYLVVQSGLAAASAVIHGHHKLMYDWQADAYKFFDIQHDPGETCDRFHDEPSIARALQSRLHHWQALQLAYYGAPEIHTRYYPPNHDATA